MRPTCHRHREALLCKPGINGAGHARYAAAMFFHGEGLLSETVLEVFRSLAPDDAADVPAELDRLGLGAEFRALARWIAAETIGTNRKDS
jgi:hypothetical protein